MIELFVVADVAKANVVVDLWGAFSHWVSETAAYIFAFIDGNISSKMQAAQEKRNVALKAVGVSLSILFPILIFLLRAWYIVFKKDIAKKLADPEEMWKKKPSPLQQFLYQKKIKKSIPILTIANFKGGSGKTMVAANLAAFYDGLGAKVLLIDLDSHGSLSDLIEYEGKDDFTGKTSFLLERKKRLSKFSPLKIKNFKNSYIYNAGEELNDSENGLVLQWITGQKNKGSLDKKGMRSRIIAWLNVPKRIGCGISEWWFVGKLDLRFNVFNYLMEDQVQKKNQKKEEREEDYAGGYDIVIIDTPTRISPAFINAICASTHFIIPTTIDSVSSGITAQSCSVFLELKRVLGLEFKFLGILPTIINNTNSNDLFSPRENKAVKVLIQALPARIKNEMKKYSYSKSHNYDDSIWAEERIFSRVDLLNKDTGKLAWPDLFTKNEKSIYEMNSSCQSIHEMFFMLGERIIMILSGGKEKYILQQLLDQKLEQLVKAHPDPVLANSKNKITTFKDLQNAKPQTQSKNLAQSATTPQQLPIQQPAQQKSATG